MNHRFNYQKVRINKKNYYKLFAYIDYHGKTIKVSDSTKICWYLFNKLDDITSKEFVSNMKEIGVELNSSDKLLNNSFLFNTKSQCQKAIQILDSYILIQKFLISGGQ